MKKIIIMTCMLMALCASALAAPAGYIDRLVFVGSSNAGDQHELNYYLENGGSIVSFQAVARNNSPNVCAFVHIIYPASLKPYK